MGISSFLLNKENLELVGSNSWKFGRPKIIDIGMKYYEDHPDDVQLIADNLAYMGQANSGAALDEVLRELVIHYYEKLAVLVKGHEIYWMAKNRIEVGDSMRHFEEAKAAGKPVFVGQSHFGATYLLASVVSAAGYDYNIVGNFPEPVGSMLRGNIKAMKDRHPEVGDTKLINLAEGDSDPAYHMIRCLSSGKIVSNVFDENNKFCKPVQLLGKTIMGGTGMDMFLSKYNDDNIVIVTPFLIRTGEDSFRYEVDRHYLSAGDVVDSFYRSLEKRLESYLPQWYFIHELHESFPE